MLNAIKQFLPFNILDGFSKLGSESGQVYVWIVMLTAWSVLLLQATQGNYYVANFALCILYGTISYPKL